MRVLVCGDVRGQFTTMLNRVTTVNKKNGPFQMLLCVGSFFSNSSNSKKEWDEFVAAGHSMPLPVYILGPNSPGEMACYPHCRTGGDLMSNLTFLGNQGILATGEGLRIAFLSGVQPSSQTVISPYTYQDSDVKALASHSESAGFDGVDILLTAEWPRNIQQFAPTPPPVSTQGSPSVAQVAHCLQPRYHFAAGQDAFYERAPYRNHQILVESPRHVTRFLSVANVGNADKKNRWIYAFQITPMAEMSKSELTRQPDVTTESPLAPAQVEQALEEARRKAAAAAAPPSQQFFFDLNRRGGRGGQRGRGRGRGGGGSGGDFGGGRGGGGRGGHGGPQGGHGGDYSHHQQHQGGRGAFSHDGPPPKRPMDDRGPDCWFCLGSPKVEKHLIVTVGEQCYVALAKGPLVDDHFLILPVGHHADSVSLPPVVHAELEAYKKSIIAYCAAKKHSCVFFERNFKSRHLQLQAVPIRHGPDAVKAEFVRQGKEQGITFMDVKTDEELDQLLDKHPNFLSIELADGQRLFHFIKANSNFPLQFAREVLTSVDLLDLPRRVHWKDVKLTPDEEAALTKKVRSQFSKFDTVSGGDDNDEEEDEE